MKIIDYEPLDHFYLHYDYNLSINKRLTSRNKKIISENINDKIIAKMLVKKLARQITKKHYSNIYRKTNVYNF